MKRKAYGALHMTAGILYGRPAENPYITNLEAMYVMLHELPDFSFSPVGSSSTRGSLSATTKGSLSIGSRGSFSAITGGHVKTGTRGSLSAGNSTISDECYLDNIASMCDIAKANGIKMLLCSIPPCDNFPWNKEVTPGPEIIRLNGKLKEYAAAQGIQYVDYFSILNNGKDGMIDEYTSDRCHPTPAGYNIMEKFVVGEINKALGTNKDYFVTTD